MRPGGAGDPDLRDPAGTDWQRRRTSAPGDPSLKTLLGTVQPSRQRFENWKLRRALRFPYFLRSTTRLSRVRNPAAFKAGRSEGS